MRDQPGSALYSLGEREVKIFSVGLMALLVLTFGAGMLVGTFWTGPVVERARREAEEETRLAAAVAATREAVAPAAPSVAERAAELPAPASESAPEDTTDHGDAVIETEAVTAPPPVAPDPAPAFAEPAPALPSIPAGELAAPQGVYALQIGIFSVESNASAMRARLAASGYEPYQVEERRSLGGVAKTLYSVRVGGYSTYGEAQRQAAELRAQAGLEVMIRRPEG